MTPTLIRASLALALACGAATAHAEVQVQEPWVRATVPNQPATGAFMRLTASQDTRLVAAETPAATTTEIHEMRMDNDIMRMREIPGLDLPAGQTVELKPGGYHLMMMGLKDVVKADTEVPLTLTFENAQGERETVQVTAPVRALGAAGAASGAHGAGHGKRH